MKILLFAMLLSLAIAGCDEQKTAQTTNYQTTNTTREFYMGFSSWLHAPTLLAFDQRKAFLQDHADMTLIHFDNGVPWNEALEGKSYKQGLLKKLEEEKRAVPDGHKLLVAITPLNQERKGLAPYYGDKENTPLEEPWKSYALNSNEVKQAYLSHALEIIEYYDPDYLAIGIEVNGLYENGIWPEYKELHEHVYNGIKKDHEDLKVFATFVLSGGIVSVDDEKWLRDYNDVLALSTYPHVHGNKVQAGYFDDALRFGMPIGIAETGLPSQDFSAIGMDFRYTEEDQEEFLKLILAQAKEHDFEFVINWANIDFDQLLEVLPPGYVRDLGKMWAYTGLKKDNGYEKRALKVWDAYLNS